MRSEWDGFQDRIVGRVADECLCEVVDYGIGSGEEDVSAIGIHCDACEFSAAFFSIFFGCWSPAVE